MKEQPSVITTPFNGLISRDRMAIMGCAMIAIMLFHQRFIDHHPIAEVFHLIGSWGVDVFLLLSGFGMVRSLQKNTIKEYYAHRIDRLLPSCVIVGFCKYVLSFYGFDLLTNKNAFLQITSIYMWFIYAIFIYYGVAPLLYRALGRYGIRVFVVVCIFSFVFTFIPFDSSPYFVIHEFSWVSDRFPVFVFGMYIGMFPLRIKTKQLFWCGSIIFIICVLMRIANVYWHWHTHILLIALVFATPMMCVACSYVKVAAEKVHRLPALEFMGRYSLEIYLWHGFIFANLKGNVFFSGIPLLLRFLMGIVVSIILAYVTNRLANLFSKSGIALCRSRFGFRTYLASLIADHAFLSINNIGQEE